MHLCYGIFKKVTFYSTEAKICIWLQWYFVKFLGNFKNIPMKRYKKWGNLVTKIFLSHIKQRSCQKSYWKVWFASFKYYTVYYYFTCYSYLIYMSSVCLSYVLVCHPYFICHSYVIHVYSYAIRMPLVCTCMSSVCHSYVLRMSPICQSSVVLP